MNSILDFVTMFISIPVDGILLSQMWSPKPSDWTFAIRYRSWLELSFL